MATRHHRPADVQLIGRARELAACETLLQQARRGGGALLLRGSAGIGKTSLLSTAHARAAELGYRVLSTSGSEAETSFPFAGLQPLLLPVIDDAAPLPEHLHAALLSALGFSGAEIPAVEPVALAVLTLCASLASHETPLLLIVDDVHWLDAFSLGVLRFVARRLSADPIALLAAGRQGGWPADGAMTEMRVDPLETGAAEAVLDTRQPELTAVARSRVVAEAAGNPLALVELSRVLSDVLRDPSRPVPALLPLTARLEAAFMHRASALTEDSRAVLLAAALAPTAGLTDLLAAAGTVAGHPVELSALDGAVLAELVDVDARHVYFLHPLIRSGTAHSARPSRRRAMHQALGAVLRDPERRLYHRVEASGGYDNDLADELDDAAEAAAQQGSVAVSLSLLDKAASLTTAGTERGGRLVRAAELSFELGRTADVRRLLAQAGDDVRPTHHAAMRRLTLAAGGTDTDDPRPVWELITLAEQTIAAHDDDGALRLLEYASTRITWGKAGRDLTRTVVAMAELIPTRTTDPRVTALIAQAAPIDGHRELAVRLALTDDAMLTDPQSQRLVGFAAVIAGDYERGARLLEQAEQQLREQARLALLATVLTFQGVAAFGSGRWRLAQQVLDEAERLADETDQAAWLNRARQMRAGMTGMYGDEQHHREIVDEQSLSYERDRAHHRHNHLNYMRGITAAMLGRAPEAVTVLGSMFEPDDPIFDARSCYETFFFLADAAKATNCADVVHRAIEVMRATVPATWPPILQSGVDYALAVTADEPDVRPRFEAALSGPAAGRPFDRARVQLAYGRWLRRQNKRLEARGYLRAALHTFHHLENEPFARQARDQLRATGEATSRPNRDWDQLTPQELQIARLVATGLSNKEIAERLVLSHRTVGSHLYRMFPKLGVTTRAQLATALHDGLPAAHANSAGGVSEATGR